MSRPTSRKTALASLLAFTLLLCSYTVGSSAYAGEPAAVFHGYVVPEAGSGLAKRVRAVSEQGVVCGSSNVTTTASQTAGFYALSVVSADSKDGCPSAGESIRFVLVYGLIDEDASVGDPVPFEPGAVTALHLVHTARAASASRP